MNKDSKRLPMWESLLSMSGSIFTFLNGDCIDFIEDFRRDSEHFEGRQARQGPVDVLRRWPARALMCIWARRGRLSIK